MIVLLHSRPNKIVEPTTYPVTGTVSPILSIIDPRTGDTITTINIALYPATLVAQPASRGADELLLEADVSAGKWWLTAPSGVPEVVDVVSCSAGVAVLGSPLYGDHPMGSGLVQYHLECTYTPEPEPRHILLQYDLGDNRPYVREALVVSRLLAPPLGGEELLSLIPALRELGDSGRYNYAQEWVDQAWDMLRARFWQQGRVLDYIRSAAAVRGALLAQIGVLLAMQGIDPTGGMSPSEYRQSQERLLNQELARLARSPVWYDADDDGVSDPGEDWGNGIRMRW